MPRPRCTLPSPVKWPPPSSFDQRNGSMDHPTAPTSHLRLVLGPQPFRPGMAWILINESPLGACVTWGCGGPVWWYRINALLLKPFCIFWWGLLATALCGFVSVQSFLVYHSPFRMLRGETWWNCSIWSYCGYCLVWVKQFLFQNYLLHIHHFVAFNCGSCWAPISNPSPDMAQAQCPRALPAPVRFPDDWASRREIWSGKLSGRRWS